MIDLTNPRLFTDVLRCLRQFTEERVEPASALTRFHSIEHQYPEVQMALIWADEAHEAFMQYEALLTFPGRGTVTVGFCGDPGVPWALRGVHRWREGDLVRVNGQVMTFQQAVACIELTSRRRAIARRLIDICLVSEAARRERITVDDAELQEELDAFRRAHGLLTIEQTQRWMEENGIDQGQLEARVISYAASKKLRDQIVAGREEQYFAEHRSDFDEVWVARIDTSTSEEAESIAASLRSGEIDFFAAAGRQFMRQTDRHQQPLFVSARRRDLAPPVADLLFASQPGSTIGPVVIDGVYSLFHLMRRREAKLDTPTRASIRNVLFQAWLEERRRTARVEWNWGRAQDAPLDRRQQRVNQKVPRPN